MDNLDNENEKKLIDYFMNLIEYKMFEEPNADKNQKILSSDEFDFFIKYGFASSEEQYKYRNADLIPLFSEIYKRLNLNNEEKEYFENKITDFVKNILNERNRKIYYENINNFISFIIHFSYIITSITGKIFIPDVLNLIKKIARTEKRINLIKISLSKLKKQDKYRTIATYFEDYLIKNWIGYARLFAEEII